MPNDIHFCLGHLSRVQAGLARVDDGGQSCFTDEQLQRGKASLCAILVHVYKYVYDACAFILVSHHSPQLGEASLEAVYLGSVVIASITGANPTEAAVDKLKVILIEAFMCCFMIFLSTQRA